MSSVNISVIALTAALLGLSACSNSQAPSGQAAAQDVPQNRPAGAMGGQGDRQRANRGRRGGPVTISTEPITLKSEIDRCAAITASVQAAGFSDVVTINCGGDHAYLTSDVFPDHTLLTGIVKTNEQTATPAPGFTQIVPLSTAVSDTPKTRDSSLAVAVNGVPIFDYTGGGEMSQSALYEHQTRHDTIITQQLDTCGGHSGRADDYHYHKSPNCMIDIMDNKDRDDAIIGWAYDGFPIYRDNNPDGTKILAGELDVCNGKADSTYGYRYHTSETAPYIIQCIMGQVADFDALPRITSLSPKENTQGRKNSGRPPRGGVENLVLTKTENDGRSLDYTYQGEVYFIRYTPSDTVGCYKFTQRTITEGGILSEGEYCR